jgi:hypothetical protein
LASSLTSRLPSLTRSLTLSHALSCPGVHLAASLLPSSPESSPTSLLAPTSAARTVFEGHAPQVMILIDATQVSVIARNELHG